MSSDFLRTPPISEPRPLAEWSRYYGSVAATAIERQRVSDFETLTAPVVVQWADGIALRVLPGDQLSRAVFVSGTYEPNTLLVRRGLLTAGDAFVDCGANAGVISLVASRWVGPAGRVYSFEPSAREYERLIDNLELSHAVNVTPLRLAVGASAGRASLRVASQTYGGQNTMGDRFAYDGVDLAGIESVEVTTLDDFIEREKVERVAVVKFDVEGSEVAALRGAPRLLADHRPALVIEVFSPSLQASGSSRDALERMLRESSYRLLSIDDSTARLECLDSLELVEGENIVALPAERADAMLERLNHLLAQTAHVAGTGSGFIDRIVSARLWGDTDLCLADVGASGGIGAKWSVFGDRLVAVGFDPLGLEVERLNRLESRPKVRYEAAWVGSRDYDARFPPASPSDSIVSRNDQLLQRSSAQAAHKILGLDYVREMFNAGAAVEYCERRLTLDEYFAISPLRPNFLKIDTDGDDFQVLLGARDLLASEDLLGVEIEVQFHGAVHEYANTFSNVDRLLRERGFTLFCLERYHYSRAALPAPFAIDAPAQTTTGQVRWGEAVYFRDLVQPSHGHVAGVAPTPERLWKLCCLFELFGLSDCAAEVLITSDELKTVPQRGDLLDALTPRMFGDENYQDYVARFNADPSRWLPRNLAASVAPAMPSTPIAPDMSGSGTDLAPTDHISEVDRLRATVAHLEAKIVQFKEKTARLRNRVQERDDRLAHVKAKRSKKR